MDLQENRKLLKINAKLLNENDKLQAEKANAVQMLKDTMVALTKTALQLEVLVDKLRLYLDRGKKLRE